MRFALLLTLSLFAFSSMSLAKKKKPVVTETLLAQETASCTNDVIRIAKAIGFIDTDQPADMIKLVKGYSDMTGSEETIEQHIYTGTAELVIDMFPNYNEHGKCEFSSSYIHRD